MKQFLITILITFTVSLTAFGQDATSKTIPLEITFNKTSNLVFSANIKSVDRGSKDVLAQKAHGTQNVLQIKAARYGFPETNLTVITADGILHEFTVNYANTPRVLTFEVGTNDTHAGSSPIVFDNTLTDDGLQKGAEFILNESRHRYGHAESEYKIKLALKNIFIKENVMFFHVQAANRSNINYTIDFLRFFIRDNRKAKRTATQEVEIKPHFVNQDVAAIKGMSTQDWVFAVEKFTIPEAKHLTIELFEQHGGRHLSLQIKNRTIVKARALP
jgi:conjugative transposon TraN protein